MSSKTTVPLKVTTALEIYDATRVELLNFRQQHNVVISAYDELLDTYNRALNEMKVSVKDHADELEDANLGDFGLSIPRTANALMLIELMGEDASPYIEEIPAVTEYKVKTKEYAAAVGAGIIPLAVAKEVEVKGSPRVSGPPEIGTFTLGGRRGKKK